MGKSTSSSQKKPSKRRANGETATRTLKIQNELGLHARAAAAFVKTAFPFKSKIEVLKQRQRANGKSIMGLLTLAAACGTAITIRATGPDSTEAVSALAALVEAKFGEE